MPDIMMVLAGLSHGLNATTIRRLAVIVEAMLAMTGRVTMLGLSRWTESGGSYRTVQRFFNTTIGWSKVHRLVIREHLLDPGDVLLMAGDEVVVTKSGKKTYGLDRFFSSLYGRAVPSVCFLSLALISVRRGTSYPVRMEQVVRERLPGSPKAVKKAHPGQRGRPKGSGNRNRREVALSAYLRFVQGMIRGLLTLIGGELAVRYFLYDGAFGHNEALQMVRQTGLHLISKLRHDAALYFPYEGPYVGRGRPKKYGSKLDYRRIPERYLRSSSVDKGIRTAVYQMLMWHKCFPEPLNVVLVMKTNLRTGATAHVVLFCSDQELSHDQLVHYYRLRFQLEFNFRDAKQYWGLEDFMVVKSTPVHNSANLALLMVNLAQVLIRPLRAQCPAFSVNDLKAQYRGRKYVLEALKWLPKMPEPIVIDQTIAQVTQLGRINYAVGTT
jgi:putative transposase